MLQIFQAECEHHVTVVRELFTEYAEQLGHGLEFQRFDDELATLPGAYAPPDGCLLLVKDRDEWVACVAMRGKGEGVCEMKRMYVRTTYRRRGIARMLAKEVIRIAKEIGYGHMRLDTLV